MLKRTLAALAAAALGATLASAPAQAVSLLSAPAAPSAVTTTIAPPPINAKGKALKGVKAPKGLPNRPGSGGVSTLTTAGYKYAGEHEAHNGIGISVVFKPENTFVQNTAGAHALVETDVELKVDNTADGINNPTRNIVEVGYTVDRAVNGGSTAPHVFVFRWVNGVPGAYNGGGFVQYSAYCNTAGAICAGDNASSWVGVQKHWVIQYFNAAWWIGIENNWIGWFPDSVWTGATPAVNTFKGVTDYIQAFGEVYEGTTNSCSDMGNGLYASNVAPLSSGVTSAGYVGEPVTNVNMVGFSTNPTLYSHLQTSTRSTMIGGPGEKPNGTTPGNPGSC